MSMPPELKISEIREQNVTERVDSYLILMDRSMESLSPEKVATDPDVQMLFAHVQAMKRGLVRMAHELTDANDQIAGLRARLKNGTV